MAINDLLSDSLTRLRNAQMSRLEKVLLPFSKLVLSVVSVLVEEGYVQSCSELDVGSGKKFIEVCLRYFGDSGRGAMRQLSRISKPGRRVYSSISKLEHYYGGLGVVILSTSAGVLSDTKARQKNLGGEVLCCVF